MSGKSIVAIGAVVFLGAAALVFSQQNVSVAPPTTTSQTQTTTTPEESSQENIVVYRSSGFSPVSIRVKVGTTVTFQNQSQNAMWTASAIHPTHEVYPGSGLAKCGKVPEGSIFDACRGIVAGGEWSFTFREIGTWKYHNHLSPGHSGTIVVE